MKTVFFDVDTQIDFLIPAGALYVPGAERMIEQIAALNRYAMEHGIPVISTMDAHAEDDPEFKQWPHHCVAGTLGQQKPPSTLLEKRVACRMRPRPVIGRASDAPREADLRLLHERESSGDSRTS